MISPGFFSLYNAQRALMTSQMALNVVNHNLANANTAGYSRQRVEISAFSPYHSPNTYQLAGGQLGQGAIVDQVIRIRDAFLDTQFQNSNSLAGYNQQLKEVLAQLEGVSGEPSNESINSAMQKFFDAAQELSIQPESLAVRANFIQSASDLVTVFQQQAQQLYALRGNVVGTPNVPGSFASSQTGVTVAQINTKLDSIVALNKQIITIKASGAQPNDLLDQRDRLLDELSNLIDIQVTKFDNGQINLSVAGGQVPLIQGANLVDTLSYTMNAGPAPSPFDIPGLLTTTNGGVVLNDFTGADIQGGRLKGLIDMGQHNAGDPSRVNIRSMLTSLNTLFTQFAGQVNALQSTGRDLSGAINGLNLFVTGAANPPGDPVQILSWQINAPFLNTSTGPGLLAAAANDALAVGPPAGWAGVGDGRNALAMAQLKNALVAGLGNSTFNDYYNGTTSNLGIAARTYQDRSATQQATLNAIDQQRQAASGVNTDEEMIDMMRFQRAFEASSKVIAMFDELYKTIINLV